MRFQRRLLPLFICFLCIRCRGVDVSFRSEWEMDEKGFSCRMRAESGSEKLFLPQHGKENAASITANMVGPYRPAASVSSFFFVLKEGKIVHFVQTTYRQAFCSRAAGTKCIFRRRIDTGFFGST